jgi:DNA-binding MarR family transcriptional regulator
VRNAALTLDSNDPPRISRPRWVASKPLAFVSPERAPARIELQRARSLVRAAEAVREFPFEGLLPADGDGRGGVSREVLVEHLQGCEAAAMEAFEQALALAVERVGRAFGAQVGWVDGVRAGLVALLEFFDEEPSLARYLVVSSAQAGSAVDARRREVLDRVAMLLDDERSPARAFPPPLAAHAVASGVLGVLHARLSQSDPGVLVELAGSLMSFTVLPFLGARAARRELQRPDEMPASAVSAGVELLQDRGGRINHRREIEALKALASEPGLNNAQVAERAGIKDQGHISRLLARLARLGLIENARGHGRPGATKAWGLTAAGEQLAAALTREAHAPGVGVVLDFPEELAGRLDFWAVCVLRAVGEQPWLTSKELAVRAGIEDEARISGLLEHLTELGLVESTREPRGRGTPKVWRITEPGRKLDSTIARAAPAPRGSLARELMWSSGGRLSEDAVAVLRVSAAEPRLSNGEIAQRVGITNANSMSQLLARLALRGLIKNARAGGRHNVWCLTTSGEALATAIRQESLEPAPRSVALDLLKDQGGRLNHRVVSVLGLIGAEPGLSNLEVAQRLGVRSKAHTSRLLARLARFGLIENQACDPTPFAANAWRLTRTGQELAAAITATHRDDTTFIDCGEQVGHASRRSNTTTGKARQ